MLLPTILSKEQVKNICKDGQGSKTCAYLTIGDRQGDCSKGTAFEEAIRVRRLSMRAKGDNCSGPPDFIPNQE
jgi:hypothetical protein